MIPSTLLKEQPRRVSKRVHFPTIGLSDTVEIDIFPPLNSREKSKLWWARSDLEDMKRNARDLAKTIYIRHYAKKKGDQSYGSAVQRIYAGCMIKTRNIISLDDRLNLWLWITHGHSRRGLERWSVPEVGQHRRRRRHSAVRSVLGIQKALDPDLSAAAKREVLRKCSEQYSRSARLFAEALGEADAVAALEEDLEPIFIRDCSLL